jgi:hypothetical protein
MNISILSSFVPPFPDYQLTEILYHWQSLFFNNTLFKMNRIYDNVCIIYW